VVLLSIIIPGVELLFLIISVRRTIHEFRDPMRIRWKIIINSAFTVALMSLLVVSVVYFVWGFFFQ
jgi:hypothetical protein